MVRFFSFKLHLIINDKGEILNYMFTPGNVDDREPLYSESFIENIKGKPSVSLEFMSDNQFTLF